VWESRISVTRIQSHDQQRCVNRRARGTDLRERKVGLGRTADGTGGADHHWRATRTPLQSAINLSARSEKKHHS